MKQLGFGLTFLSALVLATGCTDEASKADETKMGSAVFALQSGAYEVGFSATITASGGGVAASPSSDIDDDETSLEVPLDEGAYTVAIGTWELRGPLVSDGPPDGTADTATNDDPLNVVFTGFDVDDDGGADDPATEFEVTAGLFTPISMLFTVNEVPILITLGGGTTIAAEIAEEGACDPACEGTAVCASVDDVTACRTPCDPGGVDQCGGADCLAASAGGDAGIIGVCALVVP